MGILRQEYWSRLTFPSPEDLPDLEIEPVSSLLAGRFYTTEPPGKPLNIVYNIIILKCSSFEKCAFLLILIFLFVQINKSRIQRPMILKILTVSIVHIVELHPKKTS